VSGRSFRSVFMVASCAGAALGCYLVSLRVASERAALEDVESRIVMAERDIRLLETEIGTRGRLAQLERWNVRVLALSAPSADQFLDGGFALARLIRPEPKLQVEAPVVLASAQADSPRPQVQGGTAEVNPDADESATAAELLHTASIRRPAREQMPTSASVRPAAKQAEAAAKPATSKAPTSKARTSKTPTRKVSASREADAGKTRQVAEKKAGDKGKQASSKAVTKPVRTAKVDPLSPLPGARSKTSKDADSAR
jgi:hypothetical protein